MSDEQARRPARRGAKPLPAERRRSERVTALLTPAEKAVLEAEADARGVSLGEIVREALLTRPIRDALAQAS